jgi:hypothetical protein
MPTRAASKRARWLVERCSWHRSADDAVPWPCHCWLRRPRCWSPSPRPEPGGWIPASPGRSRPSARGVEAPSISAPSANCASFEDPEAYASDACTLALRTNSTGLLSVPSRNSRRSCTNAPSGFASSPRCVALPRNSSSLAISPSLFRRDSRRRPRDRTRRPAE